MKTIIITSLFFMIAGVAICQGYQCVFDDTEYFFTDGGQYKVIAIDSVVNTNNGLVYYNYPTMAEIENTYCFTRSGPSWIGDIIHTRFIMMFFPADTMSV